MGLSNKAPGTNPVLQSLSERVVKIRNVKEEDREKTILISRARHVQKLDFRVINKKVSKPPKPLLFRLERTHGNRLVLLALIRQEILRG